MLVATRVKSSEYHDSVTLMLVARALSDRPGVLDAAVVMGTAANREILAGAGLLDRAAERARPDDLVIVVKADDDAAALAALDEADRRLALRGERAPGGEARRPHSLDTAIAATRDANLVVISVAGQYAAREARTALLHGLHVLLFSDNVALEEEIALKQLALERGLLCMGPDAGTAIINGVALGFANVVPRGSVGLVSAAGTGLQAVTCGLARARVGVSQAIGVGGRDLGEAVGGRMMLAALDALQADPETQVVVLISKPPAQPVAERVLTRVRDLGKPAVVCFLGSDPALAVAAGAQPAATLAQAASLAASLANTGRAGVTGGQTFAEPAGYPTSLPAVAERERSSLSPNQRALRGLFAGGTFCYEAQLVLKDALEPIHSNAPPDEAHKLAGAAPAGGHVCVDLGEDEFTQGRLHPMIDPSLRNRRILQEARDPATAVILLDVVLGYGAHPDPAGATAEAVRAAQTAAEAEDRHLVFVASVCGTEADPQPLSQQEAALRAAGVLVLPDNASAARLAGLIAQAC